MKISGARNEPVAASRRRLGAQATAAGGSVAAPSDVTTFLGIPPLEMTPSVQGAIQALLGELDGLRGEVGLLKARLAEAEGLADRDTLTPLLNRRGFLRELGRVRTFAQRYGAPASLVYFDLDGFKTINDRHGHAAGDEALKAVADRLLANVRDSDVVGRMGGDEFALVLVQADQSTAEAKAMSLADAIEQEPFVLGAEAVQIRLSYGVREIAADADADALIAEADSAMFEAKRLRNAG